MLVWRVVKGLPWRTPGNSQPVLRRMWYEPGGALGRLAYSGLQKGREARQEAAGRVRRQLSLRRRCRRLRSACHIATLTLPLAHWGFRARPVRDRSPISEQLRQLGDVGGDAPGLVAGEQLGGRVWRQIGSPHSITSSASLAFASCMRRAPTRNGDRKTALRWDFGRLFWP